MRKSYAIGTEVTVFGTIKGVINAVSFYPSHIRYLIMYADGMELKDEWYDEHIVVAGDKVKRIGFEV